MSTGPTLQIDLPSEANAVKPSLSETPVSPSSTEVIESSDELSLEDYFQRFVLEHQEAMNETELAQKLGISRKCLWERRQRFGIPRSKQKSA
jgi:DNA-binding NtrC family response regulator